MCGALATYGIIYAKGGANCQEYVEESLKGFNCIFYILFCLCGCHSHADEDGTVEIKQWYEN